MTFDIGDGFPDCHSQRSALATSRVSEAPGRRCTISARPSMPGICRSEESAFYSFGIHASQTTGPQPFQHPARATTASPRVSCPRPDDADRQQAVAAPKKPHCTGIDGGVPFGSADRDHFLRAVIGWRVRNQVRRPPSGSRAANARRGRTRHHVDAAVVAILPASILVVMPPRMIPGGRARHASISGVMRSTME